MQADAYYSVIQQNAGCLRGVLLLLLPSLATDNGDDAVAVLGTKS